MTLSQLISFLPDTELASLREIVDLEIRNRFVSQDIKPETLLAHTRLSVRARNILELRGIITAEDLKNADLYSLNKWRGSGHKTTLEIREFHKSLITM